jgi:hypothetical protein
MASALQLRATALAFALAATALEVAAAALELRDAALRLALPAALELRGAALDLASQVVDGEAGRSEPSGGLGETGRRRETGGRRQSRDRENAEWSGLVRQISWDGEDPHLHQIFPSWVRSNPCYLHPNAPKRSPTLPPTKQTIKAKLCEFLLLPLLSVESK